MASTCSRKPLRRPPPKTVIRSWDQEEKEPEHWSEDEQYIQSRKDRMPEKIMIIDEVKLWYNETYIHLVFVPSPCIQLLKA